MYELKTTTGKRRLPFSAARSIRIFNTLTMICGLAAEGMDDKIISVTGTVPDLPLQY